MGQDTRYHVPSRALVAHPPLSAAASLLSDHLAKWKSNQFELEFAQLLQAASDFVAGLEPDLFVLGMALDHAFRGAGENNVAGFESYVAGDVADDLPAGKDHVTGVRGLARFSVGPAPDLQVVRLDLLGGNQVGAQRGELVRRFANHPLASGLQLQIPCSKVIAGTVAGHVRKRVRLADVFRLPTNDHNQLDFIIKFLCNLDRQLDGSVVTIERVIVFVESTGCLGTGMPTSMACRR